MFTQKSKTVIAKLKEKHLNLKNKEKQSSGKNNILGVSQEITRNRRTFANKR